MNIIYESIKVLFGIGINIVTIYLLVLFIRNRGHLPRTMRRTFIVFVTLFIVGWCLTFYYGLSVYTGGKKLSKESEIVEGTFEDKLNSLTKKYSEVVFPRYEHLKDLMNFVDDLTDLCLLVFVLFYFKDINYQRKKRSQP